jgi:HEAT repeat protein
MKSEFYRQELQKLDNWTPYLLVHSGLPGPRGNLELAQAAADLGDQQQIEEWLAYTADRAPVNSPEEFLFFCGVVGTGKLLAEGQAGKLKLLREFANDPRWRTREAVAMALQRFGDRDMPALIKAMDSWVADGTLLQRRAAAAALCEPRLLKVPEQVQAVLDILDRITTSLLTEPDRRSEAFKALRKGLGYCWSVAAAAEFELGKTYLEKWLDSGDKDVRWIIMQNLKKNRLRRLDEAWVEHCLLRLQS